MYAGKKCIPDRRWRNVLRARKDSTYMLNDDLQRKALAVLQGKIVHEDVIVAVNLIMNEQWRDYLVAFLFSGATFDRIAKSLWLNLEAVQNFSLLFMDMSEFKHKLEFRSYAEDYALNIAANDRSVMLLKKAIIEGPESQEFYWRNGDEHLNISREDKAKTLADMAYMKALSARNADLTDVETKEAIKWSAAAVSIMKANDDLKDIKDSGFNAKLAIQEYKCTITPEEAGLDINDLMN